MDGGVSKCQLNLSFMVVKIVDLGGAVRVAWERNCSDFVNVTQCSHCMCVVEGMNVQGGRWGSNQIGCPPNYVKHLESCS